MRKKLTAYEWKLKAIASAKKKLPAVKFGTVYGEATITVNLNMFDSYKLVTERLGNNIVFDYDGMGFDRGMSYETGKKPKVSKAFESEVINMFVSESMQKYCKRARKEYIKIYKEHGKRFFEEQAKEMEKEIKKLEALV